MLFCFSTNPLPQKIRGFNSNFIFIDESGFTPDDVLTTLTLPVYSNEDACMVLVSTNPDYENSLFMHLFDLKRPDGTPIANGTTPINRLVVV